MSRFFVYTAAATTLLLLAVFSGSHLVGQDVRGDADQAQGRAALNDRNQEEEHFGPDRSDSDRFEDDERFDDEDFDTEDFGDEGFDEEEFEDGFEDEGRFGDEEEFDDELSDDLDRGDFDDEEFENEDGFDEEEELNDDGRFDDEDMDEEEEFSERRRGQRRRKLDDEYEFEVEIEELDPELGDALEQIELAGWIGAEVGPLDPAVAAHVPVEDGQGLMVYDVLPGSPAASAGLQEFDILVSIAGTPLKDFAQLRDQIRQAKNSELSVSILRKGQQQTVQLKPGERPWNPDIFMPGSVEIPDDVEVTISKKGGSPVTVTIRQGDQTWSAASEEEFEELPERVVMWLFETMNEFMPFEEEEEWEGDWDDEGEFEEERFEGRGFQYENEEEYAEDPYERRLNDLEGKIDRILKRLESK